ncbi:hypothetical protein HK104_003585, partial [Borealophlyctis nickersoniae]
MPDRRFAMIDRRASMMGDLAGRATRRQSVFQSRPTTRERQQQETLEESNHSDGLKTIDASLGGSNVRIANRRIVTTTLKRSLALDVAIGNFDVCASANLVATTVGKVVYLWSLDTMNVIHKFGRSTGSVHRENIRDCKFNIAGTLLATCGEDKRIVIWNLKTKKAEKVMEAHKGFIYQIEFSADGDKVISASDDGRVLIWEWRTGALVGSFIRHPAAVRCFDFNYDRPDRIICGRSDGHVTAWDADTTLQIDDIIPDPDWMQDGTENNLMAWADKERHHTGAILCVRISPNNRFLATGATDNTCKLWNIASYNKEYNGVQQELQESREVAAKLDQYIMVSDDSYDIQLKNKDFDGLKIGEVPMAMGYHGDLLFTFRHEGPVLSVRFNNMSDIIITGSMDSTCRLWSARRGDLLFQINVPAPVSSIAVDERDDMYCICQNRLLIFGIKAHSKEEDLPTYWHKQEVSNIISGMKQVEEEEEEGENVQLGPEEEDESELPVGDTEEGGQQRMTIPQLRTMISHGLVLPSFLETLLNQYKSVDSHQLVANMRKFGLHPRHILRLIVNNTFHPRDILTALATKHNPDVLYSQVTQGTPITGHLIRMGFRPLEEGDEEKAIYLHSRDLTTNRARNRGPLSRAPGLAHPGFDGTILTGRGAITPGVPAHYFRGGAGGGEEYFEEEEYD